MSMFRDLGRRRLLGLATASTAILPRAKAAAPDFSEGYAIGDGARLFYVRAGGGPLMLFLHGAPDDWSLYEDQLREFGRDHLVVAPNLRGFPPSDQPEAVEAYTMPKLLGDISALLRHFGRERCVLVGNDWGGYFAWVFASAYSAWFNYYRADPIKIPPSIFEAANLEMPDLAARFFAGVADPPATRSLRVEVPTLVFWGRQDPSLLPGELDHLDDYAPHAVIIRIEDRGHYPMRSNPRLMNSMIRDFLSHTGPFSSSR